MSSHAICAKSSALTRRRWLWRARIKNMSTKNRYPRGYRFFVDMLLPEVIHCFLNAFFQRFPGFPAKSALGLAGVEVGQVDVAGAFGGAHDLRRVASDLLQDAIKFVDRRAAPSADTEYFVVARLKS